jgi:RNA polymerase sigma-70 factor (ECF subfamily)
MRKSTPKPLVDSLLAEKKMMAAQLPTELTLLLQELQSGSEDAQNRLLNMVYDKLRRIAGGFMQGERASHSWQATDLVHEAVVRLLGSEFPTQNREQFVVAAARTMWELLVEHARRRSAQKRGQSWQRVPLDDVADYFESQNLNVAAVREALDDLAKIDPRRSQVVTWHYLGRFKIVEIAAMLEVSKSTVESDLRCALAWLFGRLGGAERI